MFATWQRRCCKITVPVAPGKTLCYPRTTVPKKHPRLTLCKSYARLRLKRHPIHASTLRSLSLEGTFDNAGLSPDEDRLLRLVSRGSKCALCSSAPIVSVSLGLPAVFSFSDDHKDKQRRIPREHGEVVVWGSGAAPRGFFVWSSRSHIHVLAPQRRPSLSKETPLLRTLEA